MGKLSQTIVNGSSLIDVSNWQRKLGIYIKFQPEIPHRKRNIYKCHRSGYNIGFEKMRSLQVIHHFCIETAKFCLSVDQLKNNSRKKV